SGLKRPDLFIFEIDKKYPVNSIENFMVLPYPDRTDSIFAYGFHGKVEPILEKILQMSPSKYTGVVASNVDRVIQYSNGFIDSLNYNVAPRVSKGLSG